jgi:predicted transcriptional regulator
LISIIDILKAISDDKGLVLFSTIALANGETEVQIRKMGLTSKQYYSRISKLTKVDLIKRKNGRYSLNMLGKVVYEVHTTIGKALQYYWKLKAIESLEMSSSVKVPKDDLSKLVDTLIDNHQIKDIVMRTLFSIKTGKEYGHQQQTQSTKITSGAIRSDTIDSQTCCF